MLIIKETCKNCAIDKIWLINDANLFSHRKRISLQAQPDFPCLHSQWRTTLPVQCLSQKLPPERWLTGIVLTCAVNRIHVFTCTSDDYPWPHPRFDYTLFLSLVMNWWVPTMMITKFRIFKHILLHSLFINYYFFLSPICLNMQLDRYLKMHCENITMDLTQLRTFASIKGFQTKLHTGKQYL